jgi:hypothetical protein
MQLTRRVLTLIQIQPMAARQGYIIAHTCSCTKIQIQPMAARQGYFVSLKDGHVKGGGSVSIQIYCLSIVLSDHV